jgi:diguanylate cyclase (GGDEF)-like protein/PAS domain S-box-containing protein
MRLAGNAEFRLVRFFTGTSLLAFVIIAAAMGYLFRSLSIDGVLENYANEHANLAKLIANEMWDRDFGPLVRAMEGRPAEELKAAPQIALLHERVLAPLKGTSTFKVKVYDAKGMTVYSTEPGQIGEYKGYNQGVIAALRGEARSELVHRDTVSAFEGEVENRDLIQTYVPRYDPATGELSGVFEIYGDATSVVRSIGEKQWIIVGSVIGALSLLYLALFAIVKRAEGVIGWQTRELRLAATVFNTMDEAVAVTDAENRIVSVNPAFTAVTGYPADEVLGKDPKLLASGTSPPQLYQDMWAALTLDGSWRGEMRNRTKSGRPYVEWLSVKQVRDVSGMPTNYVAVFSDITERKRLEERMQRLASYDALTGLPNRTLFADRLQQAVAKARRDRACMALLYIDLDKFKPVNDTFGHHVGDLLLKEVANRLKRCLRRESDTVVRMGGDEFVVILPEIAARGEATMVAQKILHALGQSFVTAAQRIEISSTIGIALFPEDGLDGQQLLKSADAAMYRAKQAGRNRIGLTGDDDPSRQPIA